MVPTAFVLLDHLPLSPNGKLDRKALPAPDRQPAADHVAPQTATEQTLAAIWQDVLKLKSVGVNDNFFECGGNSLSATRTIARIQQELRVALPLRTIFTKPTLGELAEQVEILGWATQKAPFAVAGEDTNLEEGVL
jgi:acyl carrier protein